MVRIPRQGRGIGSESDVQATANDINPREITSLTIAGEPFSSRREALLRLIEELKARMRASERGKDLEPILRDAESALASLDEDEP